MSLKLNEAKKAALFKKLATNTLLKVGMEMELDKHYKSMESMKTAVYKIYNEVRATPSVFGISDDTVDLVVSNVSKRSVSAGGEGRQPETLREEMEIKTTDIKSMIVSGRNTAMGLINKKLDYLQRHPKALKETSITQLGTLFGIIFDKGQIIQGQATEHVAVMSKIDKNMKPDEAITRVLRMRELEQEK